MTRSSAVTDPRLGLGYRVLLATYEIAWIFFLAGWLVGRFIRGGEWRRDMRQRLGGLPEPPPGAECSLWLHAVSVGELLSIQPIVEEIKRRKPRAWVLLTTSNDAAMDMALSRGTSADAVAYTPWDAGWCIKRALRRARPNLMAIVECEIWPNLIMKAARIAPVTMINARIYERDFPRYRAARWVFRPVLGALAHVWTQSAADRERFLELGVPGERVTVGGNSKFDVRGPSADAKSLRALRGELGLREGPAWIWASTHDDEEGQLLGHLGSLRKDYPDLLIIIAPRDILRAEVVQSLAEKGGWIARRRTRGPGAPGDPPCDILLLDTLGELARVMALADIVFVGGSLVNKGGHNPIEAARLGKPILMGPHTRNFEDMARMFEREGGLIVAGDAQRIADNASRLLADGQRRRDMGSRAKAVVDRECGVAARYAERLLGMDPPRVRAA